MMNSKVNPEVDWEDIVDLIEEESCVLFLGPQIYPVDPPKEVELETNGKYPKSVYLEDLLLKTLDVHNEDHPYIKDYYKDGFYLFRDDTYQNKVIRSIKRFYKQEFILSKSIANKIAQIPIKIILSLSPNAILKNAFIEQNFPFLYDYYYKDKAPSPFQMPHNYRPLIYNLLGDLQEEESMVMTHNDLFEYISSTVRGKSMHFKLKNELKKASMYLFLGVPFEKWYMQFIMRTLKLHSSDLKNLERFASIAPDKTPSAVYENEFKIHFVPNAAVAFIDQLYDKCKERGILKKPVNTKFKGQKEVDQKSIMNLIGKHKIEEAFIDFELLLETKLPNSEKLITDLIQLKGQFNDIEHKQIMQTVDDDFVSTRKNQIIHAFLSLITQSKSIK